MDANIIIGQTLEHTSNAGEYTVADGWALALKLRPRSGGAVVSASSAVSGNTYTFTVAASATAAWSPGVWDWEVWATSGAGEAHRVEAGQVTVVQGLLGAGATVDARSQAETSLAAIDAYLADKAGSGMQSYSIAGRQLSSYSMADLLALRTHLVNEVRRERDADRVAAGLAPRNKIMVRMSRA